MGGLSLFFRLWAFASLFHLASTRSGMESFVDLSLVIAAVAVLLRPSSLICLVPLWVLQVANAYEDLPALLNHWLFTAFINLTLLLAFFRSAIRKRSLHTGEEWFQDAVPAIRVQVIILYFFAAFHKLNYDFFDTTWSCAPVFYERMVARFPFLPMAEWIKPATIYSSFFIECLIPVFLCFSRTRVVGVFIGIIFHYILSLVPGPNFYNFSSMLLALYVVFLPADAPGRLYEMYSRNPILNVFGRWIAILVAAALIAALVLRNLYSNSTLLKLEIEILWTVYCFLYFLLLSVALITKKTESEPGNEKSMPFYFRFHRSFGILVFFLFLNGTFPYLGLKTESTFSMFSNLKIRNGTSNHFLFPDTLRLGYQGEPVKIHRAEDRYLRWFSQHRFELTFFELRRHVNKKGDSRLIYTSHGTTKKWNQANQDQELSRKIPAWLSKFLYYRPIDASEGSRCLH